MPTSEDRQAKALEGILAQLTFINGFLRKLVEVKDLPGAEAEIAQAENRPGISEFLKEMPGRFDIHVTTVYPKDGKFLFSGMTFDGVNPGKRINGIIEDVF